MYTYKRMASRKRRVNAEPLAALYSRPGFLLRRAHQIAEGIFVEKCAALGLTPPQHGVLIAVERCPGLSQASLARVLGFDRATVGQVVEGLEMRELLRRTNSAHDKRNKALVLTPRGAKLMRRAAGAMRRTSERLLSPFSAREREVFLEFLERLANELNSASRSPIERRDMRATS